MMVVDAVAVEHLEPRCTLHTLAAILVPLDVELRAIAKAQQTGRHPWAAVEAHAVVEGRAPTDGLLSERFLAHEDFEKSLSCINSAVESIALPLYLTSVPMPASRLCKLAQRHSGSFLSRRQYEHG